jgi:hypothetical protein
MLKGMGLSIHTAADLAQFAWSINNRPREPWDQEPPEELAELFALTT